MQLTIYECNLVGVTIGVCLCAANKGGCKAGLAAKAEGDSLPGYI